MPCAHAGPPLGSIGSRSDAVKPDPAGLQARLHPARPRDGRNRGRQNDAARRGRDHPDRQNLIIVPVTIPREGAWAAYSLNRDGQIFRVWLLTPDELARPRPEGG